MLIRKYNKKSDEHRVMKIIRDEEGWDYSEPSLVEKYKKALENSITYVACDKEELCGYSRSMDDSGMYVYILDLLVKPKYRGNDIGRQLMEHIYVDYPNREIYVLSDVDDYYKKIGYKKEGSIFEVKNVK